MLFCLVLISESRENVGVDDQIRRKSWQLIEDSTKAVHQNPSIWANMGSHLSCGALCSNRK